MARQQQARLRKLLVAAHEDFAGTLQWLLRLSSETCTSLRNTLLLDEPSHTLVPVRFLAFGNGTAYFGALDPLLDAVLSWPVNRPAVLRTVDLIDFVPLVHLVVLDLPVDHLVDVLLDVAQVRLGFGVHARCPRCWTPVVKRVIDVM